MIVICPAFIVLGERLRIVRLARQDAPVHLLRRGTYPAPLITLFFGLVTTSYSLYHTNHIEFEYDFSKLKPASKAGEDRGSLPESIKEVRSPAIVLTESYEDAMEVVSTVRSIRAANGDSSTIKSVKSVFCINKSSNTSFFLAFSYCM